MFETRGIIRGAVVGMTILLGASTVGCEYYTGRGGFQGATATEKTTIEGSATTSQSTESVTATNKQIEDLKAEIEAMKNATSATPSAADQAEKNALLSKMAELQKKYDEATKAAEAGKKAVSSDAASASAATPSAPAPSTSKDKGVPPVDLKRKTPILPGRLDFGGVATAIPSPTPAAPTPKADLKFRLGKLTHTIRPLGDNRPDASSTKLDFLSCKASEIAVGVRFNKLGTGASFALSGIEGIHCKFYDEMGVSRTTLRKTDGTPEDAYETDILANIALDGFEIGTRNFPVVASSLTFTVSDVSVPKGRHGLPLATDSFHQQDLAPSTILKASCPVNYVMTGLIIQSTDGTTGKAITGIGASCQETLQAGTPETVLKTGEIGFGNTVANSPWGSQGGEYFEVSCPAGMAVGGSDVMAGNWVDKLSTVFCVDLNEVLKSITDDLEPVSVERGGGGGGLVEQRRSGEFEASSVQTGLRMQAYTAPFNYLGSVTSLYKRLVIKDGTVVEGGGAIDSATAGDGVVLAADSAREQTQDCNAGYVMTGFTGYANGTGVNALGAICKEIVVGK